MPTVEHIREREYCADGTVIEREIRRVKTEWPMRHSLHPSGYVPVFDVAAQVWRDATTGIPQERTPWGWRTDWAQVGREGWTCFDGG